MRVRMLASFSGPAVDWPSGSEQDIEAKEAQRLIDAGFAELVTTRAVETTALKPAREKRAKS